MESIWEVDFSNFAAFVSARHIAVLYTWADWLHNEGYMRQRIKGLSKKFPMISVGMMDLDPECNWSLTAILGIQMAPTTIIFVRGARKITFQGQATFLELVRAVQMAAKQAEKIETMRERFKRKCYV